MQVAGIGYSAETAEAMAAEFVTTPWYGSALRQELPPSICADDEYTGPRFRHGWFYAERVRPAGFRDGVTGALRDGARARGPGAHGHPGRGGLRHGGAPPARLRDTRPRRARRPGGACR
ncbi:hypothetical protein [Streptomyces sp. B21-083]|uniref:hypothetical protein n=1 Tax=Streptomyces sp. B21-083 TaxID=3039410 RepID=UPI002FEFAA4A